MTTTSINPETLDRNMRCLALGILLIAVNYALAATGSFFVEPTSDYFEKIGSCIGVVGGLLVVWGTLPMCWVGGHRYDMFSEGGFVAQTFLKACTLGFMMGWMTLIFLKAMDNKLLSKQPPEFFIETTLAVMLGAAAIKFFFLNREIGGDMGHANGHSGASETID